MRAFIFIGLVLAFLILVLNGMTTSVKLGDMIAWGVIGITVALEALIVGGGILLNLHDRDTYTL